MTCSESNISLISKSNNSLELSWFSQVSECDIAQPQLAYPIPVVSGYRPPNIPSDRLMPPVCSVIRRDNRCVQALSLPVILSYNMRSLWGKLDSFSEDVHERSGEIIFLCEVWEKNENKKHKRKIEELLEMKQISYISTPRPGAKRGEGLP